jgi:bisphosphoglycerate-independent phosphoglycerate mutase (AlkP superfamily)
MKQQEQDDDMANHQRHQQRQQQPQQQQQPPAHTLQLWNDVADNLAKHQTGEFQISRNDYPHLSLFWNGVVTPLSFDYDPSKCNLTCCSCFLPTN